MLGRDAIVAITASVLSIALCVSSGVLFIVVGLLCMKFKSSNERAESIEYEMNEPSPDPAHLYEVIVPKMLINQEEESMDKNIAYGPTYAVCK